MVGSALDAVPGVGPARRQGAAAAFRVARQDAEAGVEELSRVVPAPVAAPVHAALHTAPPPAAKRRPGDGHDGEEERGG